MTDQKPIDTAAASDATVTQDGRGNITAFSFGDAESVLDRRELTQYFEIWHNGRWYEPPLPMDKLSQTFNMSPHHRSAIQVKVNLLVAHQEPTRWLSADDFERFTLDFLQMGNGYLEYVPNMGGRIARAQHTPARHTRRGREDGVFWFVGSGVNQEHQFEMGRVYQLQQPDVGQEVYGMPEWLAALQSGLLNENATLFRRRYYKNGAHAGAVFYLNDPLADQDTADALESAIKNSKGIGNFKNMLVHVPNGKKDGLQIMPIAEVTAKDEYASVKNISRDDLLAAHRVPPQMLGIIPQNNGGFGNIGEAKDAFFEMEIVPIITRLMRVNEWAGVELLRMRNYDASDGSQITPTGDRIPADQVRRR